MSIFRTWRRVLALVCAALMVGAGSGAALAASVQLPSSTTSYFVYGNTSHTLSLNS